MRFQTEYRPNIQPSAKERAPESFKKLTKDKKIVYWTNRLNYILNNMDIVLKEIRTGNLKMREWSPLLDKVETIDRMAEEYYYTKEFLRLIELKNECVEELSGIKELKTELQETYEKGVKENE